MDVIVLGAGRVGSAIATDLAGNADFDVTVADASKAALDRLAGVARLKSERADLSDPDVLGELVAAHDLVAGAVPGPMGYATVRRVLEIGRNMVDISFFEEDPFELDSLAREKGCTVVVDCGVAPGFANLAAGWAQMGLDEITSLRAMCGGLPTVRYWPYEYRATFSPIDVIAEYVRPARIRRGGRDLALPALSEVEPVQFEGLGSFEAFLTDGLRTLLRTVDAPEMVEKTIRYPGHAEKMRMLRESGFFSEEPIEVGGERVRPVDVTASLLFEEWRFREGEEDLTVMRIDIEGRREGRNVHHTWSVLDRTDSETGTSSMARTTGYTCTGAVRLLAEGRYGEPGVAPPEYLGREPGCFEFVVEHLRERGVEWRHEVREA